MKLFNRMSLIIALVLVAVVVAACGGGGSPADVAKTWTEALFKADGNALRSNTCAALSAAFSDELVNALASDMSGVSFDFSGVTYNYNESTRTVAVAGTLRGTQDGETQEIPMETIMQFMGGSALPVLEENGAWKVCLNIAALLDQPEIPEIPEMPEIPEIPDVEIPEVPGGENGDNTDG